MDKTNRRICKKNENIVLISTDKVEVEIPSPLEGFLVDIKCAKGDVIPVGNILGYIDENKVSVKSTQSNSSRNAKKSTSRTMYRHPTDKLSKKSLKPESAKNKKGPSLSLLTKKITKIYNIVNNNLFNIKELKQINTLNKSYRNVATNEVNGITTDASENKNISNI